MNGLDRRNGMGGGLSSIVVVLRCESDGFPVGDEGLCICGLGGESDGLAPLLVALLKREYCAGTVRPSSADELLVFSLKRD
jgi:hypothetical protein